MYKENNKQNKEPSQTTHTQTHKPHTHAQTQTDKHTPIHSLTHLHVGLKLLVLQEHGMRWIPWLHVWVLVERELRNVAHLHHQRLRGGGGHVINKDQLLSDPDQNFVRSEQRERLAETIMDNYFCGQVDSALLSLHETP